MSHWIIYSINLLKNNDVFIWHWNDTLVQSSETHDSWTVFVCEPKTDIVIRNIVCKIWVTQYQIRQYYQNSVFCVLWVTEPLIQPICSKTMINLRTKWYYCAMLKDTNWLILLWKYFLLQSKKWQQHTILCLKCRLQIQTSPVGGDKWLPFVYYESLNRSFNQFIQKQWFILEWNASAMRYSKT